MTLPFLKTPHGSDPVIVEGTFKATPARVFRAWTNPEELKAWFGQAPNSVTEAEIDLRVGGGWRFAFNPAETHRDALHGTYSAVEEAETLVFSWIHERAFADGRVESTPASEVTVTFEPAGDGTRVRVVHAAIREEDGRKGVGGGWSASFASMQALFETEHAA